MISITWIHNNAGVSLAVQMHINMHIVTPSAAWKHLRHTVAVGYTYYPLWFLKLQVFAQTIQPQLHKRGGFDPLQKAEGEHFCYDLARGHVIILRSMESTTGWSCSRETTSQASVWSCVTTVLSCKPEAWPTTASTPWRFMEMERMYLCSRGTLS